MAFVLLVCAEVRGDKINLEFPFEGKPTIPELYETIERVYRFEASNAVQTSSATAKDALEPIFAVSSVQIYVDESRQWMNLTAPQQLHLYDQLYVLRKYVPPADSGKRELPRPRTSSYFGGKAVPVLAKQEAVQQGYAVSGGSGQVAVVPEVSFQQQTPRGGRRGNSYEDRYSAPPSARATAAAAATNATPLANANPAFLDGNATPQEILRTVFEAADKKRHGVISIVEFGNLFKMLMIQVQQPAVEEMFAQFAQSGVGRGALDSAMSFKDFQEWAVSYETTNNTAFNRIVSFEKEHRLVEAVNDSAMKLAQLHKQRQDLEEQMKRLDQDMGRENERKHCLEDELDELLKDREHDVVEDQVLVDKEVRVLHHRFLLRQEEEDFAQLSTKRRGKSETARSYSAQATPLNTARTPRELPYPTR